MKTAVIIAAGMSSRLWSKTDKTPKTLLPLEKGTILSNIMDRLAQAGITDFIIVVGWQKEAIINYLQDSEYQVKFVINNDWQKGNGISVACVESHLQTANFILSMCDHIVSPAAVEKMINSPLEDNLLLVDYNIEDVFDLDDATKVLTDEQGRILNIGKEISTYNCLDCGIFRLDSRFFMAFRDALAEGEESISAGIKRLIKTGNMSSVRMTENDSWLDIDTPEAYEHYLKTGG
ncbi:MAG: NTP transferase domain-containing protein [Candidatus Cloacimonetes bacterium]|nr:NTP transferase domain-containing protein [Candidatus Cloacimonadota bacterium]